MQNQPQKCLFEHIDHSFGVSRIDILQISGF